MQFFLLHFIIEMFLKKKNLPLFHLLDKAPGDLDEEIEILKQKSSIKYIDKSISRIQDEYK